MDRMEVFVKKPIEMHQTVKEILPRVKHHPNANFKKVSLAIEWIKEVRGGGIRRTWQEASAR